MREKQNCRRRSSASADTLAQLLKDKRLADDPNFYILAIYYSRLREGGDGELLVKLLRGKMTVKGATYLKKVAAPRARSPQLPMNTGG